jgi:transcription termination/antitermination protein NusG
MTAIISTPMQVDSGVDGPAAASGLLAAQNTPLRWYAAYTNVHHEKRVAAQMEGRSVDCFLPLYRSARRWKDRRKEIELPLFPGYVFARMRLGDRLKVLTIPGLVHIVGFGDQPATLPDAEIDMLRRRLAGARMEPHPYLSVGRRVRVHSGPVAGLEGILVRRKDRFRVVLSIELIMRSVAVEVDEADIEPAAEAAVRPVNGGGSFC